MSVQTTTPGVLTPVNVEDWLLIIIPFIGTPAFRLLVGFSVEEAMFLSVALAGFAKALVGVAQWPSISNYADWILLSGTTVAFMATAFTGDPTFGVYATSIGFLGKALVDLATVKPAQIEDGFLLIGSVLGIVGIATGRTDFAEIALIFATLGKGIPGLGGMVSAPKSGSPVVSTPPPATPGVSTRIIPPGATVTAAGSTFWTINVPPGNTTASGTGISQTQFPNS